ncbi:hypothetical protein [Leucobacter sp. cx-169]|uniref:hypothetical protein n=1 Tax=Leucobacter sp. cx-169 TaxID=2770549 RepID=UPI00165E1F7E|nr:hypothetical protein [Leucobacter sp. cx-169]MBC9927354.1 hypothetical protein [Leucobacter sp. cx-169]
MSTQRQAAGAVKAGDKIGGQFATLERPTAFAPSISDETPTLSDEARERLSEGEWDDELEAELTAVATAVAKAEVGGGYDLEFVDYDDHLNEEQIDAFLLGDPECDLQNEISDVFSETRYNSTRREAQELLDGLGIDYIDVDGDALEAVQEVVENHNTSDPVRDLAKNTPSQLMRTQLGADFMDNQTAWRDEHGPLYDGHDDAVYPSRAAYITDHLQKAGVDTASFTVEDRENISLLATDGPYNWHEGVRLDVIWYGDIRDAQLPVPQHDGDKQERKVMFGGKPYGSRDSTGQARIVLLDPMNGSGYEVPLSTPITTSLSKDRPAHLDSGGSTHGYGWDDAAGVYKPAYAVEVVDVVETDAQSEEIAA